MSNAISGLLLLHSITLTRLEVRGRQRDERGDVPGWVMVTVMSAAVVAALLPFIQDELRAMLGAAFDMVRG